MKSRSEPPGTTLQGRPLFGSHQDLIIRNGNSRPPEATGADGSDGRPKSWWVEVGEDALDDELRYLRAEIYRYPEADPPFERLTALDRCCA